jgi:SAM-dependent methyltransferase
MMRFDMLPDELLSSFYRLSFRKVLGIPYPRTISRTANFPSLEDYVRNEMPENRVISVLERLKLYRAEVSPAIKSEPLMHYCKHIRVSRPKYLLDFGCGEGFLTQYLATNLEFLEALWGIDSDASVLPNDGSRRDHTTKISWSNSLLGRDIPQRKFDIVIAVHTLHHQRRNVQHESLIRLVSMLSPGAIFYVYEDSWSWSSELVNGHCPALDLIFSRMSTTDKRAVFNRNDYLSNYWCYRRHLANYRSSYRSIEEWKRILRTKGLEIVSKGALGFNDRRLHGVPAGWLIARKA